MNMRKQISQNTALQLRKINVRSKNKKKKKIEKKQEGKKEYGFASKNRNLDPLIFVTKLVFRLSFEQKRVIRRDS